MIKRLLFIACTLAVVSCTQSRFETPVQSETSETSVYRSLEEGLEIADLLFSNMEGETRSVARTVKSVETINQATRSSSPESAFYIVNYDNNEGFALLSADKRLEAVFAIAEEGQMHLSDTIYNKSLASYIRGIENLADGLGGHPVTPGDPPTLDSLPADNAIKTVIIEDPIFNKESLKYIMPLFHQDDPYNKYCFTPFGVRARVGCAPLAAGTLMGYYEWPKSYKGYTFNWAAMKADRNHDGWARLFSFIGQPDNMNVAYGMDGTGADKFTYCSTFSNFGYKGMTLKDFSIEGANSELRKHRPLMVRGTDQNGDGHVWIIDGAKYVEDPMIVYDTVIKTYYYHCVWGWGGKDNGYFKFQDRINVDQFIYKDLQYIANLQH